MSASAHTGASRPRGRDDEERVARDRAQSIATDSIFKQPSTHAFTTPRRKTPGPVKASLRPEMRAQGMPGARCTRGLVCKMEKKTHTSIQVQRRQSDIPCAMVLRLITCSPRRSGFACHRRPADDGLSARLGSQNLPDLTPAMRRQDHTLLPYAPPSSPSSTGHWRRSSARVIAHRPSPPCDPLRARRCRVHRIPPQRP